VALQQQRAAYQAKQGLMAPQTAMFSQIVYGISNCACDNGVCCYRYFKVSERGSTLGSEVKSGVVTFLTMSYILLVNPQILGAAGTRLESPGLSHHALYYSFHWQHTV
jgi:hypothetical protein